MVRLSRVQTVGDFGRVRGQLELLILTMNVIWCTHVTDVESKSQHTKRIPKPQNIQVNALFGLHTPPYPLTDRIGSCCRHTRTPQFPKNLA